MTKLDSSAEKLISESKSRLEKRNTWLEHSIEYFEKELPKHELFPHPKTYLLPILEYIKMKLISIGEF